MTRASRLPGALATTLALCCCSSTSPTGAPSPPASIDNDDTHAAEPRAVVPLGNLTQHFHTIPVSVNGQDTTAILDTGIGLALVSQDLCERVGCTVSGEFVGKRMSGQAVRVPLTTLDTLEVGGVSQTDVVAGVIDIEGFFPAPQIEAFVGLPFFENTPFTIDGPGQRLVIESETSLAARASTGAESEIRLDRQGPALDVFVPVELGAGRAKAEVLMDTGSPGVTLHPRYAGALGIDLDAPSVERREGSDETGFVYVRHFTTLRQPLAFAAVPTRPAADLRVMFQEIIHDGLIGVEFMSKFAITYDLENRRIIVGQSEPAAGSGSENP